MAACRNRQAATRIGAQRIGMASPVRDVDTITVRGSRRDLPGQAVIRVSSFTSH